MSKKTLQPEVKLVSHTPDVLGTLAWVCSMYDGKGYDSIEDCRLVERLHTEDDLWNYLDKFMKGPHQNFMEFIQTLWIFKNVSRVFQQQLTRHRLASYAIESLRVVDVGNFADKGAYHVPQTMKNVEAFHKDMQKIQQSYRNALDDGENIEDARNVLPLNIHSMITMRMDLRSLRGVLTQRLCLTAQEEWRQVAFLMRQEMHKKLGPRFAALFNAPCQWTGDCPRPTMYCGVPLWLTKTDPEGFASWLKATDGRPHQSRIPTNTFLSDTDKDAVAHLMDQALPMSKEDMDNLTPGDPTTKPMYKQPKAWSKT